MIRKKVYSLQFTVYSLPIKIFFLFSIFYFLFSVCYAQPLSSADLINNAKQYDGAEVFYQGEIIGDIMVRGDHAWININDGENALGVWIDKNLVKGLLAGSYKYKGDWVEVNGVFHRSCPQHGGDMDIHARTLQTIQSGKALVEKIHIEKQRLSLILLGLLCLILILKKLKPVSK